MDAFIRRENIRRYRKLLPEAKDEAERRLIKKLLTEEEQRELAAPNPSRPTARRVSLSWGCAYGGVCSRSR